MVETRFKVHGAGCCGMNTVHTSYQGCDNEDGAGIRPSVAAWVTVLAPQVRLRGDLGA
jgi:hypothetical protein